MAQPVFSATERTFPRRISRRAYAPFCKVHVRFGLLSLLRRVRWIALGALCAKGLWCRNAQANAATVPLMRSLRQYGNVMFDTLALCEYTECRMPTDRVLVSQISIGRRDRESLQQDRKHCQFASLVRHVFPASLSCLELGAPSEASGGFSNFNRTLGSGELATGQETLPIRVLGSARFFCFPFFSESLSLPRGDTKNATRKATEPPFAF